LSRTLPRASKGKEVMLEVCIGLKKLRGLIERQETPHVHHRIIRQLSL
jgi:hypothetical protein